MAVAEQTDKPKYRVQYSHEAKQSAKGHFLRGFPIREIAKLVKVPEKTLYNWKNEGRWDELVPPLTVEEVLAKRICELAAIEQKTAAQIQEQDRLILSLGNLDINRAKARKIDAETAWIKKHGIPATKHQQQQAAGTSTDKRREKSKGKAPKNDISEITPEMLDEARNRLFTCEYTRLWHEAKENELTRRIRFILKSRQIGATYYFAWEAFEDAVRTGDNQIFLSASKSQAQVFKAYIIAFAKTEFDVELKGGDELILSNGAQLRFLATNATTAQSYTGHLYIDEVFWIPNFQKLNKVAGAIATHKKWRKTYFSTPSAQSHQAFPLWNGEKHNAKLPEKKRVPFDVSHDNLKNGLLMPDGIWRHIVTVQDAEDQGFGRIDIDMLRMEYSDDEFNNLFMGIFIDDAQSVFSLEAMLRCVVDQMAWEDYDEASARPYGNKPVAIGYDTGLSEKGDAAERALLGIPIKPKDPFRLLNTRKLRGQNFEYQANRLQEDCDSHNVQFIGLDTNGIGVGVHEYVQKFFPMVTPLHYSQDMKNRLIMKMLDLVNTKRFQVLERDKDIISSFMMIKKSISNGNGGIIYRTERNAQVGHGDSAWSVINGVSYEPLVGQRQETTVTIQH